MCIQNDSLRKFIAIYVKQFYQNNFFSKSNPNGQSIDKSNNSVNFICQLVRITQSNQTHFVHEYEYFCNVTLQRFNPNRGGLLDVA